MGSGYLNHILVHKGMAKANTLRIELRTYTPDQSKIEFVKQVLKVG